MFTKITYPNTVHGHDSLCFKELRYGLHIFKIFSLNFSGSSFAILDPLCYIISSLFWKITISGFLQSKFNFVHGQT